MVQKLPYTIVDEAERYDSYSSVISPPDLTTSTNTPSTDVEVDTKLNTQLSSYTENIFLYKYCEGKANTLFTPYLIQLLTVLPNLVNPK